MIKIRRLLIIVFAVAGIILGFCLAIEKPKGAYSGEPASGEIAAADEGIDLLIEKLKSEDSQVSQEAADGLAGLGKRAVPKLLGALKGASIGLKGQIIFILGRIQDKRAMPALRYAMQDENAYIRGNAAIAFGKIKDKYALDRLTTALSDDDAGVKKSSARALGELKDPQAVEDLIDRLTIEKDESSKTAIVKAFAKIRDQRTTYILLDELKSQNDQLYKNEVVFSLGEIGDLRAIPQLTAYLDNLKSYKPVEKIVIYAWQQAIRIAEEAINKIRKANESTN